MEIFFGIVGFVIGALVGSGLLIFLVCAANLNKENDSYEKGFEDGIRERHLRHKEDENGN